TSLITIAPVPAKTRKNVPNNSAASFCITLGRVRRVAKGRQSLDGMPRSGRILIPPPTYAVRRKGTQRLRCSLGRCSRRGSLKAAFRWWYQEDAHDRGPAGAEAADAAVSANDLARSRGSIRESINPR